MLNCPLYICNGQFKKKEKVQNPRIPKNEEIAFICIHSQKITHPYTAKYNIEPIYYSEAKGIVHTERRNFLYEAMSTLKWINCKMLLKYIQFCVSCVKPQNIKQKA